MTTLTRSLYERIAETEWTWKNVWLFSALIALGILVLDPDQASIFFSRFATTLGGTLPYIAIAVLLIAAMKAAGAEGMVGAAFKGNEYQSIVFAALIGGLAPFCSCEVIPFIAALLVAGVPLAPIMAFWLASPLVDPASMMITAGALGWDFAIGKVFAAIGIGLLGGFALSVMMRSGMFADPLRTDSSISRCGCGPDPFSQKPEWKFWQNAERMTIFSKAAFENALFLIKWLTLAYLIEVMMIMYIPSELVASVIGGEGLGAIFIGALVGMPAYLNGYAAPALLSGLIEQGMSSGAAMSFLAAGAVSCIPAMAAVFALVKKQVFAAYVAFGFVGAILSGIVFQLVV